MQIVTKINAYTKKVRKEICNETFNKIRCEIKVEAVTTAKF